MIATSISVRILASISAKSLLLFAVFRRGFLADGDRMGDSDFEVERCEKDTGSDEKLAREALE